MQTMAERVEKAMDKRGLSAGMLAIKSGLSERVIRYCIAGRTEPRAANIRKLCKALDVSADWLLGMKEEEV